MSEDKKTAEEKIMDFFRDMKIAVDKNTQEVHMTNNFQYKILEELQKIRKEVENIRHDVHIGRE